MKGNTHLLLTGITLTSLYLSFTYVYKNADLSYLLSILKINIFEFSIYQIIVFIMVMLGSILPDSDVKDNNSKIFHSIFMPIAWLYRIIDIIFSFIQGQTRRHRGVLHSPYGTILANLCLFGPILVLVYYFGFHSWGYIIVAYLSLVIGQFIHIFQDYLYDRFRMLSGIIYLICLTIVLAAIIITK
ncbi:MAG: metal-dependent hydrolase [Nanoarchaeota archaeon]|nr:metal-dependent hydrolase [Nanoarchaeota archaeon]